MQKKVLVGNISPEGTHLLTTYLNAFEPNAIIEPLKPSGLRAKMKTQAKRQNVVLVIIDEDLTQQCIADVPEVFKLPKVHRYNDDDGLKQFLISKFGRLDGVDETTSSVPPDELLGVDVDEDDYIPRNTFNQSSDVITPPDKLIEGADELVSAVKEDEFESFIVSDDDDIDDNDAIINDLRDKLASSEMMVRNLTLQLQDKASGEDDISEFVARIKELENQLEDTKRKLASAGSSNNENEYILLGKVAKAEQVLEQFDTMKADLASVKEDRSALEYEKTKLTEQVDLLNKQIDDLKLQVAEIESLRKSLSEKEKAYDGKLDELSGVVKETETLKAEIEVLQKQIDTDKELLTELDTLKSTVNKKQLEIDNLTDDLESKSTEITNLLDKIDKLKENFDEKVKLLEEKDSEISKTIEEGVALAEQLSDLESKVADLNAQIDDLNSQVKERDERIESLEVEVANCNETIASLEEDSDRLAHKDAEIGLLTANLEQSKGTINQLNNTITELNERLVGKDSEINSITSDLETLRGSSDASGAALDKALKEKSELEDKLVETETKKLELSNEINDLNSQISQLNDDVASKNNSLREITLEKSKLENEIGTLKADLINAKADDEVLAKMESDLLEERRRSAKLQAENEVLKKTDDSNKASELRLEIVRLQDELKKSKSSGVDSEELQRVQADLMEVRERCTSLELDLADRDAQLNELSSGVFSQMANLVLPRVAFNASLPLNVGKFNNIKLVASGSAESILATYQLLRRTCVAEASKRVIIVDLVTDSYIDKEFGIKSVTSPIDWLTGKEGIKNYISSTRYGNVKVISTALTYMNDIYLLGVDWQRLLQDLSAVPADAIFINIGYIGNTVAKVLFNTLNKFMSSYIVTKATPTNLRTVYLNMSGFADIGVNSAVSIECVDYAENSAKMYQRISAKYKSRIMRDSDILKL